MRIIVDSPPKIVGPDFAILTRPPRRVITWEQGEPGADAHGDLAFSYAGAMGDSEESPGYALAHGFSIDVASNYGYCTALATVADAVFHLFNKATPIGTVTYRVGVWVPDFALSVSSLAAQSFIYALAPSPPNATLRGAAFTIASA